MKTIDIETWDRKGYFKAYAGTDFPYINVGAHLDITRLLRFSRKQGLSSYLALIFSAHRAAEGIRNFRYRIMDGKPVLNDSMCPCFTYLQKGADLFINVIVERSEDIREFHRNAKERIARQGNDLGLEIMRGRLDLIKYSAIPWIQYTHVVRTIAKCGVDSVPKISWGKYFKQGDRDLVPFSVQVHHGLMDGLHVGRYFETLQRYVDGL